MLAQIGGQTRRRVLVLGEQWANQFIPLAVTLAVFAPVSICTIKVFVIHACVWAYFRKQVGSGLGRGCGPYNQNLKSQAARACMELYPCTYT